MNQLKNQPFLELKCVKDNFYQDFYLIFDKITANFHSKRQNKICYVCLFHLLRSILKEKSSRIKKIDLLSSWVQSGSSPIHSKFSLQTIGSRCVRYSPSFLHAKAHFDPQIVAAVHDIVKFLFFKFG